MSTGHRRRQPRDMSPEDRAALGERTRRAWARLTPEQRTERGRLAYRTAQDARQDPEMQPVRISPEFRQALQVACTRWAEHGASATTIESLAVAIVVEGPALERPLMLLSQDVDTGTLDGATFGALAALADKLVAEFEHLGDPARVCDLLALLVGIEPGVPVVQPLPPAPGDPRWVQ